METMKRCSTCGTEYSGNVCPKCMAEFMQTPTRIAPSAEDAPLQPGEIFHGLEVIEPLGKGGMGVVYKARQPALNRIVALKLLPQDLAQDPEFQARFQREARALATLSHPNIVSIYDFGAERNIFFLVMEFVDGMNLRQLLRENRLTPEEAFRIVPQLCDALGYAHAEGVVHRDIKPENILIDRKGRVKIADFGLAKLSGTIPGTATLTGTDVAMGTPRYMAPEQFESTKGVDHRADIYSMGVVFYEMLTGEVPMGRFDPPSRKVQVDVRLDKVVLKALEREPERRYQSTEDVKTDVAQINPSMARSSPRTPARGSKPARKGWLAAALLAGILFVLAWGLLPTLLKDSGPRTPPPVAGKPPLKDSPTPKPAPGIPSDAVPFNGRYYKLISDPLPWPEARTRCEEMGGHLVTVTTPEESRFVNGLTPKDQDVSIGLSDAEHPGSWTWVTGEPVEFTDWCTAERYPRVGDAHYVQISYFYKKKWMNVRAQDKPYICEWEPSAVPNFVPRFAGTSQAFRLLEASEELVKNGKVRDAALLIHRLLIDYPETQAARSALYPLAIVSSQEGVNVFDDRQGLPLGVTGSAPLVLRMKPGRTVRLRFEKKGYTTVRRDVKDPTLGRMTIALTGKSALWRMPLGFSTSFEPLLLDDQLFIAGGTRLYALRVTESDGRLLWFEKFEGRITGTPVASNRRLFLSTDRGGLHAIDPFASPNRRIWDVEIGASPLTPPAVSTDGKVVYVGTDGRELHALDAATGGRHWSRSVPGKVTGAPISANGEVLIACSDGTIMAVRGPGAADEGWRFRADPGPGRMDLSENTLFVPSGSYLIAIHATRGNRIWKRLLSPGVKGRVARLGDSVFAAERDGSITILDAATGDTRGTYEGLKDPSIVGTRPEGTSVLVAGEGRVHSVDAKLRTLRWSVALGQAGLPRCAIGVDRAYAIVGTELFAMSLD